MFVAITPYSTIIFFIDTWTIWGNVDFMKSFTVLSAAEQVAEHLRAELLGGNLRGGLPGANPLAAALGVNHKTVKSALEKLEAEGLLAGQGRGRQRKSPAS